MIQQNTNAAAAVGSWGASRLAEVGRDQATRAEGYFTLVLDIDGGHVGQEFVVGSHFAGNPDCEDVPRSCACLLRQASSPCPLFLRRVLRQSFPDRI